MPSPAPLLQREQLKIVLWRACPHCFQSALLLWPAPVSIDRRLLGWQPQISISSVDIKPGLRLCPPLFGSVPTTASLNKIQLSVCLTVVNATFLLLGFGTLQRTAYSFVAVEIKKQQQKLCCWLNSNFTRNCVYRIFAGHLFVVVLFGKWRRQGM